MNINTDINNYPLDNEVSTISFTISKSNWSSNTNTVEFFSDSSTSRLYFEDNSGYISPADADSLSEISSNKITIDKLETNKITFKCETVPTSDIEMVLYYNTGYSIIAGDGISEAIDDLEDRVDSIDERLISTGEQVGNHTHSTDDITSGVLPKTRGGTGTDNPSNTNGLLLIGDDDYFCVGITKPSTKSYVTTTNAFFPTWESPDTTPTSGSTRLVTSDGIYTALSDKADSSHTHSASDITSGTLPVTRGGTGNTSVDTTPTSGSTKMVTSGGVYTALSNYLPLSGGTLTGKLNISRTINVTFLNTNYNYSIRNTNVGTSSSSSNNAFKIVETNNDDNTESIIFLKNSSLSYIESDYGFHSAQEIVSENKVYSAALELATGAETNGGYIDFHYGQEINTNQTANEENDYTTRIIENAYGELNIQRIGGNAKLKVNNYKVLDESDVMQHKFCYIVGPTGSTATDVSVDYEFEDAASLNSFLASLPSYRTVRFLPGTYTMNADLEITKNVNLEASGHSASFEFNGSYGLNISATSCRMTLLSFSNLESSTVTCPLVRFTSSSSVNGVTFDGCRFYTVAKNAAEGVSLIDGGTPTIRNLFMYDTIWNSKICNPSNGNFYIDFGDNYTIQRVQLIGGSCYYDTEYVENGELYRNWICINVMKSSSYDQQDRWKQVSVAGIADRVAMYIDDGSTSTLTYYYESYFAWQTV